MNAVCRAQRQVLLLLLLPVLFGGAAVADKPLQEEASQVPAVAKETSRFGNFLALPIFITEPAIGEGLGLGLVYFHKDDKADTPVVSTPSSLGKTGKKSKPPPTATGIFGFYTSNQTAGVGLGHSGSYFDDQLRVVGALASLQINAALFQSDIPVNFGLGCVSGRTPDAFFCERSRCANHHRRKSMPRFDEWRGVRCDSDGDNWRGPPDRVWPRTILSLHRRQCTAAAVTESPEIVV